MEFEYEHSKPQKGLERLDYYLDIDYVSGGATCDENEAGLVHADFSASLKLPYDKNNDQNHLYVILLYNFMAREMSLSNNEINLMPGGGCFLMHQAVKSNNLLKYICPLKQNRPDFFTSPCALCIQASEIKAALDKLRAINCTLSMPEETFAEIIKSFNEQTLFHNISRPICIIPSSSTLDH